VGQRFSIDRCKAMLKGYLDVIPFTELSHLEKNLLSKSGTLITLELASRFGRDFLEDDYFAYDAALFSSRRDHNFHRVGLMVQLATEMQAAEDQLLEYCWSFDR
jgi:hypothetical protein